MYWKCDIYIPKLAKNLLSINQLTKQGFMVEFETTKCWLKSFDSNKVIVEVLQKGRLYKLVGVVQFLIVALRLRGVISRNSNMFLCKL
jgi:hypothetical protein